ncbi:Hypothetical_protein [Hexamita inflata]|uniref:Hypothetical_protein n=1 Tax=Hexamita inflata TaxID=28002 RepID=A0AA86QFM9_9EUKA|nr:Hypothetical protein HINF_LOCUS46041 [Hexamita inflata]
MLKSRLRMFICARLTEDARRARQMNLDELNKLEFDVQNTTKRLDNIQQQLLSNKPVKIFKRRTTTNLPEINSSFNNSFVVINKSVSQEELRNQNRAKSLPYSQAKVENNFSYNLDQIRSIIYMEQRRQYIK